MSTTTTQSEDDSAAGRQHGAAAGRLIPPYVDTTVTVFGPFSVGDLALFLPAVGAFGIAIAGVFADLRALVWGGLVGGAFLAAAAGGITLTTPWYASARERLRGWITHLRRWRTTPEGHEEGIDRHVHEVEQLHPDGTATMADGRRVGLLRVEGSNVAMTTESERARLADEFAAVVNRDIKDFDFRLFSTTTHPDDGTTVGPLADRAATTATTLVDDQSTTSSVPEFLSDIVSWARDDDAPQWQARKWHHYVVIDVAPVEVDVSHPSLWERLDPRADPDPERVARRQRQVLADRLNTVSEGLRGVGNLRTAAVEAGEHAALLTRYWTDANPPLGERAPDESALTGPAADSPSDDDAPPAHRLLAPSDLDPERGTVKLGDQYARTFWIAEWPAEPEPAFLRELYSLRGVSVDVCLRMRAADKRATVDRLERTIADIDAEAMERAEASDVSALDAERDVDAYVQFRQLLRESPAQPWRVSGYVTVRADSRDALARAAEAVGGFDSAESAAAAALANDAEQVRDVLESAPARCFAVPPGTRQLEAFAAGAPTTADTYDRATERDKTATVPGGAIGAMFPFVGADVRESAGMDWGRNEQTGLRVRADPFARGSSPHLLTVGKSRSGKTYAAQRAAARWYAQSDEHALIVCDTQGGFDGLTELFDGRHLVVDGSQTINPLDIQPAPDHERARGIGIDPFRMHVDQATQWIAGIIRAQGVDPAPYISTIEELVEATYRRADIYPNDLDSHARESPTPTDLVDTCRAYLEAPAAFTLTGHEREIATKVERLTDLLDRLHGLQEGGRYHRVAGETETGLADGAVDMAYLDLRQFRDSSDAEKSVMLQLMLSQVYQKVRRHDGKLVFMLDEAHVLFHSDDLVRWLQKAAREWARYDAALWFISQSPREFLQQSAERDVGQENERRTIVDQCSTVQVFYMGEQTTAAQLRELGLNERQIRWVQTEAVRGKQGRGYSECLLSLDDRQGWLPTCIAASPLEDAIYSFDASDGVAFSDYLADRTVGDLAGHGPPRGDLAWTD